MAKRKASGVKKFSINKLPQKPEGLSHANEKREACQFCAAFRRCSRPFRLPEIPDAWTGKLLLVTDDLSQDATKVMQKAWRKADYRDEDVAVVTPTRCPSKRKPTMAQIRACRPFLLKALEVLKPKYVLGLGATALRALTNKSDSNLTKARGKLLSLKETK